MKKLLYLFTLLTFLTFTFACSGTQDKRIRDFDSTALTVALLPTMECLPFYVAQESGIYDSLGLQVNLVTYEAAMDADTAFTDTVADGCVSDLIKACLWRSLGDSVCVVMTASTDLHLVTTRQARIRTAQSLKEKIIAITRHSALDYTADQILSSANLQSEELNKPQINNIALRMSMTDQNQYDGALLPEPYASMSVANGATRVISSSQLSNSNPLMALIFRETTVLQRSDEIRMLVEGYTIAAQRINRQLSDDPQPLLHMLPVRTAIPDSAVNILLENARQPYYAVTAPPSDSLLTAIKSWLRTRDLFGKDFPDSLLIVSF